MERIEGNLNELDTEPENILPTIEKWRDMYGGVFKVWYGPAPTIILADPEHIQAILNRDVDVQYYHKGYEYEFKPWLGESILLASGDVWRSKRKKMNPAFHHEKLRFSIFNSIEQCTLRLIEKWENVEKTKTLDLHSELNKLGLDIIGRSGR